ncbi:phosphoribosylformylglycinamidine synthase [Tasmannia lanceolata]|uniref:phosphoribosylformylglycinamidine synthase n=1 Tax=Tasmannia lanceolata TaxID=3420 RepID=UPI004062C803
MNATLTSASPAFCYFHGQKHQRRRYQNPKNRSNLEISSSLRRKNTKMGNPKSSSDQRLEMVIDLDDVTNRASASLKRFFTLSEAKFHRFISSGSETLTDLQTLVTFDRQGRMIVGCRYSSLQFLANFAVWSFVFVYFVRFLVKLGLGLGYGMGFGNWDLVRRRDRSLAGREVVVGRKKDFRDFRVSVNPLSDGNDTKVRNSDFRVSKQEALPRWWPDLVPSPGLTVGKEDLQREANKLIRAIMDNRMSGKDLTEDDIIQLRQICKTSGARVFIETANARDSFYRASVDFVLNSCCSITGYATLIKIDGEEAPDFIAGLADNIGLDNIRAARIVCAAVAARTRSRFLQAWALEIQGKRSEALDELLKICLIHQTFPPEENSPEMEMVARGLQKHLTIERREHLLKLFGGVCGAGSQRSAAEALGLMQFISPGDGPADGY